MDSAFSYLQYRQIIQKTFHFSCRTQRYSFCGKGLNSCFCAIFTGIKILRPIKHHSHHLKAWSIPFLFNAEYLPYMTPNDTKCAYTVRNVENNNLVCKFQSFHKTRSSSIFYNIVFRNDFLKQGISFFRRTFSVPCRTIFIFSMHNIVKMKAFDSCFFRYLPRKRGFSACN